MAVSPDQTVSSLMEVEYLRGSAWYKVFIIDYEAHSQQAVITFGNHFIPDQQVPLSFLRSPPSPSSGPTILQEKGTVEALAPAAEGEPEGWWNGRIAKMKGEFYVVEFESQGALFTDIFEGSKVRPVNSNEPFSETNFPIYRTAIEVPLDLQPFCSKDVHGSFKRSIGAMSVSYRPDHNTLVFLAKSQSIIYRAILLSDMHIRNLRTKMKLKQQASDRTNPKPSCKGVSPVERVEIGTETNVTNTICLRGILQIDLEDDICTLHITGVSDEAIDETEKRFKLIDLTIDVHRKSISRFMRQKDGINVSNNIAYKKGVAKVEIEGDDTTQPGKKLIPEDSFNSIGHKEYIRG